MSLVVLVLALVLGCTSVEPPASAPVAAPDPVVSGRLLDGTTGRWGIHDGRWVAAPEGAAAGLEVEAELVLPGLIDAHCHPAGLGQQLAELDLVGTTSIAEIVSALGRAEGTGWVIGRGWDQNDWSDHEGWPTATDLDAIPRPVALRRVDGHALWLNSQALAEAGISRDTQSPSGGELVRDAAGNPTGILVDGAMALVELPEPSEQEQERRLRLALEVIARSGLVGVHDMGIDDVTLGLYDAMADELPVRVWAYVNPDSEAARRLVRDGPWRRGRLAVVGVKAYADGALGSRGAHLSSEYTDRHGHEGIVITPKAELEQLATSLLGAGAQLAVHAIGDAAVREALDAFAAARAAHPARADVPLRVEHAQVVHPDDLDRFAALNVVASMQPTHATSDMPWVRERLGPEREDWTYSWRAFLDRGVTLAFGSDFPVERVSPTYGLWAATTRTALDGTPEGGWRPEHRLSLEEAVHAFSAATYQALGEEGPTLAQGERADASVVRRVEKTGGVWLQPHLTIVEGQVHPHPDGPPR